MFEKKLETANKEAAEVQITAEQLIREASALSRFDEPVKNSLLEVGDDLIEHKAKKRKEYEDVLRRRRIAPEIWISYGKWEFGGLDFDKGRSVFERALTIDYENVSVWNAYLDQEIKHNFVNSARNIFDRVTYLLPRISHFWLRYILFEEAQHDLEACTQIFEKWLRVPSQPIDVWFKYLKFKQRHHLDPLPVHARMMNRYKDAGHDVLLQIAKFCRAQRLPYDAQLLNASKRVEQVKDREIKDPYNYDSVYTITRYIQDELFIHLEDYIEPAEDEEEEAAMRRDDDDNSPLLQKLVSIYSDTLKKYTPKNPEKAHWKKWFYICVNFALLTELYFKDMTKTERIYKLIIAKLEQANIQFKKIFKFYSDFLIRQNTPLAKIEQVLAKSPEQLYNVYLSLNKISECFNILVNMIKTKNSAENWIKLINLTLMLNKDPNSLLDIAKKYHPHEIYNYHIRMLEEEYNDLNAVAALYNDYFKETQEVKILVELIKFKYKHAFDLADIRATIKIALDFCKQNGQDELRAKIISLWLQIEKDRNHDDDAETMIERITKMIPTKIKKKKTVVLDHGETISQEYVAYIFNDDDNNAEANHNSIALLKAAQEWQKKKKETTLA